jgi:hypothetical protein
MTTHHDTGVIMSPQPSQDGRWATFVPASYKNMALGEAQLAGTRTGGEVGLRSFYSPGSESRCWRAWRGCGLRGREPNQHTAFPGGEPTRCQSPSLLRWQLGSRWVAVLASAASGSASPWFWGAGAASCAALLGLVIIISIWFRFKVGPSLGWQWSLKPPPVLSQILDHRRDHRQRRRRRRRRRQCASLTKMRATKILSW